MYIENAYKKLAILGVVIYVLLSYLVGPTSLFGLSGVLEDLTGYFFAVTIGDLDYFVLSLIPILGNFIRDQDYDFELDVWLKSVLKILLWILLSFTIGLFLLVKFGRSDNPLILDVIVPESSPYYSVLLIVIGMGIPFLIQRRKLAKQRR